MATGHGRNPDVERHAASLIALHAFDARGQAPLPAGGQWAAIAVSDGRDEFTQRRARKRPVAVVIGGAAEKFFRCMIGGDDNATVVHDQCGIAERVECGGQKRRVGRFRHGCGLCHRHVAVTHSCAIPDYESRPDACHKGGGK